MLLEVENLSAGYGFLQVLWDVSFSIETGEHVCIIGPNGAGKSSTLKTICGLLKPSGGKILYKGESIGGTTGNMLCQMGISYVSENMNLFTGMTVKENLAMGAFTVKDKLKKKRNLEFVFDLFPRLEERISQYAGTLSGGERKMLAIGRSIMSSPTLLLVDEPSFGLAPQLTASVFKALSMLRKSGVTILLVEQNVKKTLQVADRGYVLEKGKIAIEGNSQKLSQNEHVKKVYLGV